MKMTKNKKIIIGAASAVAVLGIALAVVLNLPSENLSDDTDNKDIILFDKSAFGVDDVTVKNQSGEYQLLGYDYSKSESDTDEDIPVIYTMQGYENSMLSKLMTDELISECRSVAATRIVDKSGKKYKEYGLDKPKAEVRAVYSDQTEKDMFFTDKLQMFEKQLTSELEENEKITEVNISGTAFDKDIYISREKSAVIDSLVYTMTSPYDAACDTSTVTDFATSFFGVKMSQVAAAGAGQKELEAYGLKEPYMNIKVKTDGDRTANILVSEKDSDGKYYIMKSGGTIIYSADDDEFKFYDTDRRYFLDSSVYKPNMSNIDSVQISYNENTYEYTFDKVESINELHEYTYETTVYYQGQKINYMNLSDFIFNISNIYRQDNIPESIDGCREIFRINSIFDEGINYELVLYQDKDNKIIAVTDGNIESYVDELYVSDVIKQTAKIPTDETIEILKDE